MTGGREPSRHADPAETGFAPVASSDGTADPIPLFDRDDVEWFLRPFVRGRRCS